MKRIESGAFIKLETFPAEESYFTLKVTMLLVQFCLAQRLRELFSVGLTPKILLDYRARPLPYFLTVKLENGFVRIQ